MNLVTKVSIVSGKINNIIVGVVSHKHNIHDSKTLSEALDHANSNRTKPIQQAVCDRGYRGVAIAVLDKGVIRASSYRVKGFKRDSRYQER